MVHRVDHIVPKKESGFHNFPMFHTIFDIFPHSVHHVFSLFSRIGRLVSPDGIFSKKKNHRS